MSTPTLQEAISILQAKGYHIWPMPAHMPKLGHWWLSDPGLETHDEYSECDLLQLAEALRDQIVCAFCGDPALSRCPTCGIWTCEEDRRDFTPDGMWHFCAPCVERTNKAVIHQIRLNLISVLSARIADLREEAEWDRIMSQLRVQTALRRLAEEARRQSEEQP